MIAQGAESNKLLVAAIDQFNELLASNLESFTKANKGVTAKIVDTAVAFNTAIKDPESFGAPDATCYNEDGVSCVSFGPPALAKSRTLTTFLKLWFNDYHPGVAIEKLVAAQVAKAWDGFFECSGSVLCES